MVCLRNNRSSGLGGWQRWRSQWSCDKEGRDEGQSTSREEEATQRVRDALEEHETCGTPYTCVCVCEGRLGGAGEHPRPPAGSMHTDAQPTSPQMQTPRHWSVRNPPGQEQLLLNQG